MARDPIVSASVTCTSCGTRFAATRDRCPRCRAVVVSVDPAVEAAKSRKLVIAAAILMGTFVAGIGLLWLTKEPAPSENAAGTHVDPFAQRRQSGQTPASAPAPESPAPPERPFLDPSGAGALAYDAGDYAAALARFQEAIDRNPNDAESLSNLGQVLVKVGRTAEAVPLFERATTLIPDRWAYRFNLARALGLLNRWDESIASYRHAQQLFPDDYVTTFNLGLALHKKGDEGAAVEEYKKAIALQPDDASFRMALAISYERLNRPQDAAAAYAEYLRLAPTAPDADKVRTRMSQIRPVDSAPSSPGGPADGSGR